MSSWLDAARHYSNLDDLERSKYWLNLDSGQQAALTKALASLEQNFTPDSTEKTGRKGAKSFLTIGCIGFAAGVVLTIGVQIIAVASGVGAVKGFVGKSMEPTVYEPLQCNPPRDAEERKACSDQYAQEALHDLIRRRQQGLP